MALPSFGSGVGGMLFGMGGGGGAETTHVGGGKNAKHQQLSTPHTGLKNTMTPGDPLHRAMGHYGKRGPGNPLSQIRGGGGGIRRARGGLGPGKKGVAGPSGDYSMKNEF